MAHIYARTRQALSEQLQIQDLDGKPLCLDLEWDSHAENLTLSLLQFHTTGQGRLPVVADAHPEAGLGAGGVLDLRPRDGMPTLRELISSQDIVKVLHDARQDDKVLQKHGVQLGKCFDTSIAHELLTGETQKGLVHVLQYWLDVESDEATAREMKSRMRRSHFWMERPLDETSRKYAAEDVRHLPELYLKLVTVAAQRDLLGGIFERSAFPRMVPKGLKAKHEKEAAVAFGKQIRADETLRERCTDKLEFLAAVAEWKDRERTMQPVPRFWRCNGNAILMRLTRMNKGKCREHGLLLTTLDDNVVTFHEPDATASDRAANVLYATQRVHEERDRIESDKGGISVSAVTFMDTLPIGNVVQRQMVVTNDGNVAAELVSVKLLRNDRTPEHQRNYSLVPDPPLGPVEPGGSVRFTLRCHPRSAGMLRDVLSINFSTFSIGRYLEARAGDAALLEMLQPRAPYQRRRRPPPPPPDHQLEIERAPRPEADGAIETGPVQNGPKLKGYDIDPSWRGKIRHGNDGAEVLESGNAAMLALREGTGDVQSLAQYRSHFEKLLWSEEIQLNLDLTEFAFVESGRGRTSLESRRGLHSPLAVTVPGLAENRPSVLKGDRVRARLPDDPPNKRWEGVAEEIQQERVGLRFSVGFTRRYVGQVS